MLHYVMYNDGACTSSCDLVLPPGERVLPAKIFSHGQTLYSVPTEGVCDMPIELLPITVDWIQVTLQYTRYLEYMESLNVSGELI